MKALAFAGFVSRTKKWEKFETDWDTILKLEKVSSFHMTDFVSNKGEFKAWKGDSDRRKKFVDDLVKCIKRYTHKGFASGIFIDDYNYVNRDFMLAEQLGQPYTLSGYSCVGALGVWALNNNIRKSDILIIVEDGDQDQGEFLRRVREDGFKAIPMPKSYSSAFQAADLIGWKYRTVLQEVLSKDPKTEEEGDLIMRSLEPLKKSVQSEKAWNLESLCELCVKKNFQKRN